MPKDLLFELRKYLITYPDESSKVERTVEFINTQKKCFDRDNWSGHFTGSAWVVDQTKEWILMTHHNQLNMWLQLGGHAEGRTNLKEVALTEAKEESGLSRFKFLSENIFDIDIHKIPEINDSPAHSHFDVRYILQANRWEENIVVSDESHDVAWIHKDEVLNKNSQESIERMLFKTYFNN